MGTTEIPRAVYKLQVHSCKGEPRREKIGRRDGRQKYTMYETCWTPRQGPQGTEGTAYRSGVHQKPGKGAAMKNEMVGTPASNM